MFKIQTLNVISPAGLTHFPADKYEINSEMINPDAIIVRSHPLHTISFPSSIKVVGRAGAGVNNIPVEKLTQAGIPVLNTPGANANAVKELVIAAMLLAARNICDAWHYVKQLQGDDRALHEQVEQEKKRFAGFELMGKTLGIIGLGSVGVKIANAAVALGMRVIGYDPAITVKRAWELSASVEQAHSIDSLLSQSDFVSVHVPLMPETRHLINAERIKIAKTGLVLLNFSRESIVDESCLPAAFQEKKISKYINDFPCEQLQGNPHVISLPHLGASTQEAEENCAVMIVKQIRDFLEHGNIMNSVNFPTIEMPFNQGNRIAIVNANVPNMVAQISSVLAGVKLNILDLLNRSKEAIAYTLIDVDGEVNDNLIANLHHIPGVIQVRRISRK